MNGDVDPEELLALVSDFRASLQTLERAGLYSVSGLSGQTVEESDELEEAVHAQPPMPEPALASEPAVSTLTLLREYIGDCQRCSLAQSRQNIVFGTGSETASLMFIGEAPGADEDRLGEPFVGASGKLLDKMIVAMGWSRDTVYIANVIKCRPPGNRDPKADEIAACEGFLARQIALVKPAVIVTLGKPAAHLILKSRASMSALRGVWQDYAGIPVMPTYHPAYLLRDPSKKRDAWADLQQVMAFCKAKGLRD